MTPISAALASLSPHSLQVPQLFVGGKYLGGCTDIERLHSEGSLRAILKVRYSVSVVTYGHTRGFSYTPCNTEWLLENTRTETTDIEVLHRTYKYDILHTK